MEHHSRRSRQFQPIIGRAPSNSDSAQLAAISANMRLRLASVVGLGVAHGEEALDGDGQETDDGRRERDEDASLSQEPQQRRQLQRSGARQHDVQHVGESGQQVRQRQVAQQVVHGHVELLVLPDGHEHDQVLHDDEEAHEERGDGFWFQSIFVPAPIQFAGVVIMTLEHYVAVIVLESGRGCIGHHSTDLHGSPANSFLLSVMRRCGVQLVVA